MHYVVTGFDAFDSSETNPSQLAVELITEQILAQVDEVHERSWLIRTLATCCGKAWSTVEDAVKALPADQPFAVILSGLARGRTRICLERFALNVRSYRVADNCGHQWQEEYIDSSAPDALRSTLPLSRLSQHLNSNGLMADISNYAGSFVCNETYFRALQKWGGQSNCRGIIFVHFPEPVNYIGVNNLQKAPENLEQCAQMTDQSIREYARALKEIVKFIDMEIAAGSVVAKA